MRIYQMKNKNMIKMKYDLNMISKMYNGEKSAVNNIRKQTSSTTTKKATHQKRNRFYTKGKSLKLITVFYVDNPRTPILGSQNRAKVK